MDKLTRAVDNAIRSLSIATIEAQACAEDLPRTEVKWAQVQVLLNRARSATQRAQTMIMEIEHIESL